MAVSNEFEVQFWGVRGGVACPGDATVRYGGNTACVEVRCGGHRLIFDAGTGIRPLGTNLVKLSPITADVFFSHTNFERICGVPFFAAAFHPKNTIRFWADHQPEGTGVRDALVGLMSDPVFPVPIEIMGATLEFNNFRAGEAVQPAADITVRSAAVNTSVPVTGYRVEWGGRSLCYVSDLIIGGGGDRAATLDLMAGADVAIVNVARSVDHEADWRDGLELCDAAQAKTYVVFHHDPEHDDDHMDAIAAEAEAMRPGSVVAREGMTLSI